jgi:23S rRNA (cytidine1920-2'-O)/16S rRNA (cytidine1409-2'-O)-methyltransferase
VNAPDAGKYVSRGGLKLQHALKTFEIDVSGLRCADLGCSTGGFTDCLLRAGARSVVAVDTGYGVLEYKLRIDERVTVLERTNAVRFEPTDESAPVDLVVIDLGWTPQRLAIPAALRWIGGAPDGRIISLIKPHYELSAREGQAGRGGVLEEAEADRVFEETVADLPSLGVEVLATTRSPITGGGRKKGNIEWLALLRPSPSGSSGLDPAPR